MTTMNFYILYFLIYHCNLLNTLYIIDQIIISSHVKAPLEGTHCKFEYKHKNWYTWSLNIGEYNSEVYKR